MKCFFFAAGGLLGALVLSCCTTTSQVSLDYVPGTGAARPGAQEFTTRPFADRREMGPNDLGTVRTQIGTPVEQVQTRVPAAQMVTNAFGYGLQARNMLTSESSARFTVTGEVLDLYCQLLVRPYGYARLRVSVLDANTGEILHSQIYTGERQGAAYIPGSGSPVPLLRDLASGALQDAVDRALDDEQMRGRIGTAG